MKVLIASPNKLVAQDIVDMLATNCLLEFVIVESVNEAFGWLSSELIDVALMDLALPDLDLVDTIAGLRLLGIKFRLVWFASHGRRIDPRLPAGIDVLLWPDERPKLWQRSQAWLKPRISGLYYQSLERKVPPC